MSHQPRDQFHQQLEELERQTLGGLDLVTQQLDRAMTALDCRDVELAVVVITDDDRLDGRYLEVHQGILSLLATQTPVAGDLRVVAALLHAIRCIERMGDQCVDIAKLVPPSGYETPQDQQLLDTIKEMGELARRQVDQAKEAFAARSVELALDLGTLDAEVDRLNREVFRRAVEIGDDLELREWATFMVLVARALERIGDNAVDIAKQTLFVVKGLFHEYGEAHGSASQETASAAD